MKLFCIAAVLVCFVAAAGHWKEAETDNDTIQEMSVFAAKHVSKKFNSPYHHKLVNVLRAKTQVVSGMNYEVQIELEETKCEKAEYSFEEAAECEVRDDGITKYCTVRVWDQIWTQQRKVTQSSCHSTPP